MEAIRPSLHPSPLDAPTIGALAHLYRGEIYRSTIWRTRLDNTTNWAVVTLGIALSVTFSRSEASPLPLLLAGILCIVFLIFEARRYRYFNVWRARARWIERNFYAPMLRGETLMSNSEWSDVLASDYCTPRHHISFARAIGRRLRRNYIWILGIQTVAYYGKIAIHPGAGIEPFRVGPACQSWSNSGRANVAGWRDFQRGLAWFRCDHLLP
jgi:uncharacterized membrane protein